MYMSTGVPGLCMWEEADWKGDYQKADCSK